MPSWLYDIVYPVIRWLHMVCTTLIVGGTLFFELVLPIAIEELAPEQRWAVMGRARWVFRWVVYIGVAGLLLSGGLGTYRMWQAYRTEEFSYVARWATAHMIIGALAIVIALLLTIGRRPPEDPIRWMRLNLVILLVAIFLGSATRHFQLALRERQDAGKTGKIPESMPMAAEPAATRPSP